MSDDDLDAVERDLTDLFAEQVKNAEGDAPFIERPKSMDIQDGALCWLDGSRVCGADCVAFNVEEMGDDGELVQGPNKCLLMLYMGQQGSAALTTIAVARKQRAALEDAARRQGVEPPSPYGKG